MSPETEMSPTQDATHSAKERSQRSRECNSGGNERLTNMSRRSKHGRMRHGHVKRMSQIYAKTRSSARFSTSRENCAGPASEFSQLTFF